MIEGGPPFPPTEADLHADRWCVWTKDNPLIIPQAVADRLLHDFGVVPVWVNISKEIPCVQHR